MNINHPVPPMPQLPLPPDGETAAAPATTPAAAPSPKKDVEVITDYTNRDVLNGRGQGVQRHPGNVKYRTLVFVNKTLYAKCPRSDKIKISKGIVKAIRNSGGRFLDLDERTNIYTDIGDKKATEKTSQALREGQTQIRKDAFQNKVDQSLPLLPNPPVKEPGKWEIPEHDYMKYSMEILEHLYSAEENMTAEMAARPAPHSVATQAQYLGLSQNRGHTVPQPYPIAQQMPAILPIPTPPTEAQFMGMLQHLEGHPQQHQAQGRIVSTDLPIQQHMRMNPNANVLPASKRQRTISHPMSQPNFLEIMQRQSSNGMPDYPQLLECVKQTQNELRSFKKDGGTAQAGASSSVTDPSQIASTEATKPSKPSAAAALPGQQQQQQSEAPSKDKKKSSVEADIAQTLLGLSRDGKEKADE